MSNLSRRAVMRSLAATGLSSSATPLLAEYQPRICELNRTHGDWILSMRMSPRYDEDDNYKGMSANVTLEHASAGLKIEFWDANSEILAEQLHRNSNLVPTLEYRTSDILRVFTPEVQPDGPENVSTYLLVANPDTGEEHYVIWDHVPNLECSADALLCYLAKVRENPESTSGWFTVTRSSPDEIAKVYPLLFETNHPSVQIGYYDRNDDTWPSLANYELDTTGLEDAINRIFADGFEQVRRHEPSVCELDDPDCFLTTACCNYMGRADDCTELRILRGFRDGWLVAQPGGPTLIAEYYRTAPAICRAIGGDAARLRRLYWGTILPCVLAIRLGANGVAFRLYCRMMRRLQAAYPAA